VQWLILQTKLGSSRQSIAEDPNLRSLMDTMAAHWSADQPVPPQPADPETLSEPEGDSTVESGEGPTIECVDRSGDEPMGEHVVEEPAVEPVHDVEELRLQREAVVQLDFSSQFFSFSL